MLPGTFAFAICSLADSSFAASTITRKSGDENKVGSPAHLGVSVAD